MSVALTNNVSYTMKPTSVKCSRKQLVIPSSNKTTFDDGETCVWYLPSLRNHVMDGQSGYLRFTVKPTTTGRVDNTAHSFIDRIQTYGAGGALVSDIQNYGVLANMMVDLQLSQSEKIGLSGLIGAEDDYGTTATALTYTGVEAKNAFATLPAAQTAAGDAFATLTATSTITNSNRKGQAVTTATEYTFCIPLLHPFFTLSEKYIPVFAMGDDTRIELTWASFTKALVTCTDYTISNPEIVVDYIEFDNSVFPLIQQTYSGRDLVIPAQDYHYYSSSIASGTKANFSQIIPAKQQSARAFFFAFRPAESQVVAGYCTSSRVNPFWTAGDNFSLSIGGLKVPQHPITTKVTGEFSSWMASTQGALHAFNALEMNGSINRSYYQVASTLTGSTYSQASIANSYRNGFCLGLNLDSLRGQSETQNSGVSLANVTTYYEGYMAVAPRTEPNPGAEQNISVDTYLLHDVLFIIDSAGNVSVKF